MVRRVIKSIGIGLVPMLFYAQSTVQNPNKPVDGAAIYKVKGISNFVGFPVSNNNNNGKIQALNLSGDTISFDYVKLRKLYEPEEVEVYSNRKFHYHNTFVVESAMNFGANYFCWNNTIIKQLDFPLEIGFGFGLQHTAFQFTTSTDWVSINIFSMPSYLQAKYSLFGNKAKFYAKGAIGLANNVNTQRVFNLSNGFYAKGGLGISFASRNRFKQFIEFNEVFTTASGTADVRAENVIGNVEFKHMQFTRFTVTYGIQIGK
ncbi:MAG: hypothetical protein H6600_01950 [Flavobacteriales bacterium]|nr:hypothetical protein [Flavobacteriales bacterium]MCB9197193.1 hypothetical protein [Flavobacteriales bacterium]